MSKTVTSLSSTIKTKASEKGMRVQRLLSTEGTHPYDQIEWELRDAVISNEKGVIVFEQRGVEVPKFWSQTATNIVVSKYFWGQVGHADREYSARQLIDRVAKSMANWGRMGGYFATEKDAQIYEEELTSILINQYAAFNSPVWFNVGVVEHPQCSACFILEAKDDMRSIMELAVSEAMLFKGGSGSGFNMSPIRSSRESLSSSSGRASGPVSFMKGFDAFAGVISSGGRTRRAAKMVILNIDHPDIVEFINCKVKEEKKAHILIDAGLDPRLDGEVYTNIFYQNANNSVRVSDEFMEAVERDDSWQTRRVVNGEVADTYKARELMKEIAEAAWFCGDPGMQYDSTINSWHTCSNTDRIHASNPCSEYMFLNNTACNLSSINLLKFRQPDGSFDFHTYRHVIEIMISAMEMLVDFSSYPTEPITMNSHRFRPLGLGYANLGALLMSMGLAYDSDEGRNFAAALTAFMSGIAYRRSAEIAGNVGPFAGYSHNEEPMLKVMEKHRFYAYEINPDGVPEDVLVAARRAWDEALDFGRKYGYRNSQISVLAPTGTIAFIMDCDTTGVEPDIALVKYKWMVGGGMMKIVNRTVPLSLKTLGYTQVQIDKIQAYIDEHDTIEGAPELRTEHLSVFDCAFKPKNGERSIHYLGHLKMMSATQPFISGAISKTVNVPEHISPEEIAELYLLGWKLGLKAVAIYRDGCKRTQPLTTSKDAEGTPQHASKTATANAAQAAADIAAASAAVAMPAAVASPAAPSVAVATPAAGAPRRERLPDERQSITHKFSIAGHEGYMVVGLFPDGRPGELFVTMSKEGSTISGMMDAFATVVSIALQYGVPLEVLVNKFSHSRFEPAGYTTNPKIRIAKSVMDYMFRWMAHKFLTAEQALQVGVHFEHGVDEVTAVTETVTADITVTTEELTVATTTEDLSIKFSFDNQADAPTCQNCGSMMVRNASCYKCMNCGETSGCS